MAKRSQPRVSLAWYPLPRPKQSAGAEFLQQGASRGTLRGRLVGQCGHHPGPGAARRRPQRGRRRHAAAHGRRCRPAWRRCTPQRPSPTDCVKEMHQAQRGSDIPAHDGTTPLHTALKKEYLEAFKLLLRHEPILTSGEGWPNGAGDRGAERRIRRYSERALMTVSSGHEARTSSTAI